GAGTTSEIALAIKYGKPVVLLEMPLVAQTFFQHLSPAVRIAQTPDEAISLVGQLLTMGHQAT
ncbi:MAG: hypothetical protein Q6K26_04860, partial [Gloeomargarita sp. SZTDM-1c_bins_89]